ncbi:glycosyl hydrolase family 8 [Bacillus sp. CGMCC 1.60114]|uniref:glycosyl hydrolase family 8 n=1 Tax=unclassified Bacillus (in: firmicutes) TaxID=185979 RepID=UPI00363CA97C
MRKRFYLFIVMAALIVLCGVVIWKALQGNGTEQFIIHHMTNENGTLATYRLKSGKQGTDVATGREALSESSGLWLRYALDIDNQEMFDAHMKVIQNYFLDPSHIVLWKITESGKRQARTNALIDDLRIVQQLYRAYEKYGEERYKHLADQISDAILHYNKKGSFYVDYYDANAHVSNDTLTTSYVNPKAFSYMKKYGKITDAEYQKVVQFLADYPRNGWAFPKTYEKDGTFTYDKEVNIIDQSYVAYYRSLVGLSSEAYLDFLKKTFQKDGKLYGRYDLESGKPAVAFESPAAYGITILYVLEAGERKLAEEMYEEAATFRNKNPFSRYYGGYVTGADKNTHIFDNLLPLLAETALKNSK